MTDERIIFLDIDGPMIPYRAFFLPGNNELLIQNQFDPCAVSMINRIIKATNAKLVISSTRRLNGKEHIEKTLTDNGIDIKHLHDFWCTPQSSDESSRTLEIKLWLVAHPEVSWYCSIDDEELDEEVHAVNVSYVEGMQIKHMIEMLEWIDPENDYLASLKANIKLCEGFKI